MVLDEVATDLFQRMAPAGVESLPLGRKGILKDFLVDHPLHTNARIGEMMARYRKYPQDFYRETPIDGRLYFTRNDDIVRTLGTTRRKRFKRIAEKCSRRIIDYVFERIKGEAELLAKERAMRLGVPLGRLNTPIEKQKEEFVHAERRVVKRIRLGTFLDDMPLLDINDVFGIKVFCEDAEVAKLTGQLQGHPRMEILEYELHSGAYNALNIVLKYRIDKDRVATLPPSGDVLAAYADRGLTPSEVLGLKNPRGGNMFLKRTSLPLWGKLMKTQQPDFCWHCK